MVWVGVMEEVLVGCGLPLAWIFLCIVVEVHSGVWAWVFDGAEVHSEMLVVV